MSTAIRKQLTEQMVNDADKVVVIMEETEDLPDYLSQSTKMERWSIADPKGKDLEFTRKVKNEIKEKIEKWCDIDGLAG